MNHKNAKQLLPASLLKELQTYIQGDYLYIPIDTSQQKQWGEASGYRKELNERNARIKEAYHKGCSIEELAETYFLSIYAIRKIIYQK